MRYDSARSRAPRRELSKNIGKVNPKTSIVVVDGKEKLLVCQIPTILTEDNVSRGLGLMINSLISEPIA